MSSKPVLFLVHGFMGSALNWGPIMTRLKQDPDLAAAGWTFMTADLLGHGARLSSPLWQGSKSGVPLTLDLLTQDLMLQAPQVPFVALGHSFGLRPLLRMSTTVGAQKMKVLIAEDAGPEVTPEAHAGLHRILDSIPTPFKTREEAKAKIEELFAHDLRLAAFLFSNIRSNPQGLQDWRFDKTGLLAILDESQGQSLWPEWQAYEGQAFVMRGERSEHLSMNRANEMIAKRASKTTQLIQIPQSGHWIHSDQAGYFTAELVKILKNCQSLF